ncbi:MAG: tRNA (adenosine(37)-N6)-threonylcarbamoyltransferase complex ATPase subunit type 1 TsaE [Patescibacteria group bacterium]
MLVGMNSMYKTNSKEETQALGVTIADMLIPGTLVTLSGDLGAGKTTLTQGILECLGAEKPYTSPTFVIMKEYTLPVATESGIKRVYHVDTYRIQEKDLEHLGFEEWCSDPSGVVILEWPERVVGLLPGKRIAITLTQKGEKEREIGIREK